MATRDFAPSPVFVGIVALTALGGWLTWSGVGNAHLGAFLFVAGGWVVSLCLHEYAHAVTAYRGGDFSVVGRGYLRLDPLKYTHPVLSIVLPLAFLLLGGIGLPGGAVWVNRAAVRSRAWESLIGFAGPGVNLLCAVALVLPFSFGVDPFGAHSAFWVSVAFLAFLQLTASVLNLVPMLGVDGGNLVEPWLSAQWQRGYRLVAPYGMLLLIALLWTPVLNNLFFTFIFALGSRLGLPVEAVGDGLRLFQFWGRVF